MVERPPEGIKTPSIAQRTYRNSSYPIIAYTVVVIAIGVVLGVSIGDRHAELWEILLLAVSLAAVSWIAFRVYAHPRVVSDASGITVINPFHTSFIAWSEVHRVGAGMRLVVKRNDGTHVSAWAVQAANAARMTGHRSFADDVADDLNRLLVESRGGNWSEEAPEYAMAPIKIKALQRQAILAAGFILLAVLIHILT